MIFSADFLHGIWLKQAQLSSLSNREWEALVLLLRSEMLLARFAYWYENESEGFPAFVQAHLGNAKTLATRQAKQVEIEARMLVPLCSQFSQHILFLKGAAYTLLGGQLAKGRVYSDIDILIEIVNEIAFIGTQKINAYGGLPVGTGESALSLISSGIDSPVASFEMIKRGVKLDFVHFHSYPAINKQSIENVKEILNILTKYQLQTTLYLVPLLSIQQKIMELIPDKYWVIFFRRAMIKIANIIAKKIDAVALVTGDSVGQVASQTLSNLRAVSESSQIPILRPLSGMNKEDIINKAKLVKTYDVSVLPYEDCCSFFVPKHPETKAKMKDIKVQADKLNLNDLLDDAINNIEKVKMSYKGE